MPVHSSGEMGPFHVHRGHVFEGFRIENRDEGTMVVALCMCGVTLDVADAVFAPCPECEGTGRGGCVRCGATGEVVHHAALEWRLPTEKER